MMTVSIRLRLLGVISLACLLFLRCGSEPESGGALRDSGSEAPAATPPPSEVEIPGSPGIAAQDPCQLLRETQAPLGQVPIRVETVATGLEVPWAIAFISGSEILVTERPGRVRLIRNGEVLPQPVMTLEVGEQGEGGLLGMALDPKFAANREFYLYYTTALPNGGTTNRLQRFELSEDHLRASPGPILLDQVPSGALHNGGRILFGPDKRLYVGTGDARTPELAQDPSSPAGKLLRLNTDGSVPADNPIPGNPAYLLGVRNTQGFDWIQPGLLLVTDHGPSGELGRSGHDELNFARPGDNLGWPTAWRCDERGGLVAPALVWEQALPPGGAVIYRGNTIPEWRGSLLISSLGAMQLHRVQFQTEPSLKVTGHEVYRPQDESGRSLGRLREAVQGPDGALYLTTSNCDGRGSCGAEKDKIVRISRLEP
jgi:aldose sugar dehydrogenase